MGVADTAGNGNKNGAVVLYLDENSMNRALAELLLRNAGLECRAVETFGALIDAMNRGAFDALVLESSTIASDPEGLALAQREPRFRDLPTVVVGDDEARAAAMGASRFVPFPLDPVRFLAMITEALGSHSAEPSDAIRRAALLARVGGKAEAAATLLDRFMHDYAGHDALIAESLSRGDKEKTAFLLRNLRAAAGAIGADELYRVVESVRDETEREQPRAAGELSAPLRRAVKSAAVLRAEFADRPGLRPLRPEGRAETQEDGAGTGGPSGGTPLLLAVDDSAANRRFISESLADEFGVILAENGDEALQKARSVPAPALILLDVEMPGIDGYETCRLLKEDPRTRSIPVIFLTSLAKEENEERGLSLGAVDYIRKPFSVPILKARVRTHLELLRYREYLETLVEQRTRALRETQKEVIFRLAQAAEYRDNDTGSHIKRIGYYSAVLAERLGFPRAETDILFYACSMHDIGKIGIPDHILRKPGKLTEEEWAIMKKHPTIGAELLEGHPAELLRVAARVARTHHEKWDGSGYPAGLAGAEIPMEGRIVAICDVFDALLSVRPYKRAWTYDEALDEINRLSGRHFDPVIVRTFNGAFPELANIKKRFDD